MKKTAKMTSEGARYSCPTAKVMVNLKPENKIETVVASRVLMNMELVEGESANRLRFLYWVTRHQVHLHHLSTKGVSGVCLSA